jgi:hypothetical protein
MARIAQGKRAEGRVARQAVGARRPSRAAGAAARVLRAARWQVFGLAGVTPAG